MRSEHLANKLSQIIERQVAMRAVLRTAHMPSQAVAEVARQLRQAASELEAIADEANTSQARGAEPMRGAYLTR
jgi:hypothetical protein